MVNAEYRPRLIDKEIERKLGIFKAICIQGPKASGKTWAAAEHSRSSIMLGDPSGSFENRRLTELDPFHALSGEEPHLIDEWQEVPSLWDEVRHQVDTDSRKGRYILTGSSTPVNKGIMHSGTGRIDTVSMRTMSLFESGESSGRVSLSSLFDGGFGGMVDNDAPRLEELAYYIIRGGWPEAITIPPDSAHYFARSYVNGLLTEDISRIAPGTNIDKMSRFMRSLARNESTTASKRTIQRDLNGDISDETIDNYSNILARLFIIADQRPYSPSVRSSVRLKQMSKRHLTDPSLAAALLGLSIRVTEYRPFLTGLSRCGQRLNGDHDVRFVWSVVVRGQRVLRFRCGASVPGERLLDFARREDLECLLRLYAPDHTVLIIGYEE